MMRDYAELVNALRHCVSTCDCPTCPVDDEVRGTRCIVLLEAEAADAIEELLAKVPKEAQE